MSARTFLFTLFASFGTLALVLAAFNLWVDPFQHYREPNAYAARFYPAYQRHQNPGLAKHRNYNTVVIGSSLFENITAAEAKATLGGEVINLSLSAMSSYDMQLLANHVLAQGKAQRVVLGIDLVAYSGDVRRVGYGGPPPMWAYNRTALDDAPYLLSLSTAFNSVEALAGWRFNRFSLDRDKPWYWAADGMFSEGRTVAGLDAANLNRVFKQPPMRVDELLPNMHANLLPLLRNNPRVQFDLVLPPYSILVWADYRQRGALAPTLAFKKALLTEVLALPNVVVHDFQSNAAWTHNLALYKDIYHYSPTVTTQMLQAIQNGSHRVLPHHVESAVRTLDAQAARADAVTIINQARAQ
jgi:hypothetical protein